MDAHIASFGVLKRVRVNVRVKSGKRRAALAVGLTAATS